MLTLYTIIIALYIVSIYRIHSCSGGRFNPFSAGCFFFVFFYTASIFFIISVIVFVLIYLP